MANKVLFGMKNIHVGTFTEENGVVTMGAPYHQKGAVGFSPEKHSPAILKSLCSTMSSRLSSLATER